MFISKENLGWFSHKLSQTPPSDKCYKWHRLNNSEEIQFSVMPFGYCAAERHKNRRHYSRL